MLHQRMDPHPHLDREHMTTRQIGHGHIEVGSTRTPHREGCFVVFFPFWMPSAPERAEKQLNAIGVVLELFRTSNAQLLFRIFFAFQTFNVGRFWKNQIYDSSPLSQWVSWVSTTLI